MISNHSSLINERRPSVDLMTAQVEAFVASGGKIQQAPPSLRIERPIILCAPRDEAADLKYKSARQAADEKQAFVDKIREMAKTMTQKDIVDATGVGRKVLIAMGQKHGFAFRFGRESQPSPAGSLIDRTRDAGRVERILAFKEIGLTRAQTIRKLEISEKLLHRLLTENDIDYPKQVSGAK